MHGKLYFFLILAKLFYKNICEITDDFRNYLVSIPEVLHAGVGENISISVFDYDLPIHVSAKIEFRGNIVATSSGQITNRERSDQKVFYDPIKIIIGIYEIKALPFHSKPLLNAG